MDALTTAIYSLSLHDALPISSTLTRRTHVAPYPCRRHAGGGAGVRRSRTRDRAGRRCASRQRGEDRKSTRLNSSHQIISYAVFRLKKEDARASIDRRAAHEQF